MAFDFLGTMTVQQLLQLADFLDAKILEVDNQANHFLMQAQKVRNLKRKYETCLKNMGAPVNSKGVLTAYRLEKEANPASGKYEKKLYEDQIFEQTLMKLLPYAPSALDDTSKAVLMDRIKKPFIPEIKFQRENLEYRIRKCGDLIDQYEERRMLKLIARNETASLLSSVKEILSAESVAKSSRDIST